MRATVKRLLGGLVLSAALAVAGCSVDTTGASCATSDNCPDGQSCVAGKCQEGTGASSTSVSSTSTGSTSSSTSTGSTSSGSTSTSSGSTGTSASTSSSSSGSSGTTGPTCSPPVSPATLGGPCDSSATAACQAFADGGSAVLSCDAQDGGCFAWGIQAACGALTCLNAPARCDCPPVTGSDFAADPLVGGLPDGGGITHTGASDPVICRFPTLTQALDGRSPGQSVTVYNHVAPWRAQTTYALGDLVTALTHFDGHVYRAKVISGNGKSAHTEPAWPPSVGSVVIDNSNITWELIADADAFVSEPGLIGVPEGVTLRGSECATGVCDNTYHLVINFNAAVLKAGAGATIKGINLIEGASGTTFGIQCNSGTLTLDHVGLLGFYDAANPAPLTGDGLQINGSCSVVGTAVYAALWHNGLLASSSGASQFAFSSFGFDSPPAANNTGALVEQGQVAFLQTAFINNRTDGLQVDKQTAAINPPVVTALESVAAGNMGSGISVNIGSVAWTDGGIAQNGIGLHIEATSNTVGSTTEGVKLVNTEVSGNTTLGIDVTGTHAQSTLVLESCNIRDNGTYGVRLEQASGSHTTELFSGTAVHSNGNATAHTGGGLFFATPSVLARFVGNQIFANYGDQITFDRPAPSGDWVLNTVSSAASSCMLASAVYCYDGTNYGIVANHGATVDAKFFRFQNAPPAALTRDFSGNVNAPVLSTQTGYCGSTPALTCP